MQLRGDVPVLFGPAKPDQEWCSGVFGMEVTEGDSDGVDLSGAKLVMHFELPGDFMSGIDKAKLYFDRASPRCSGPDSTRSSTARRAACGAA